MSSIYSIGTQSNYSTAYTTTVAEQKKKPDFIPLVMAPKEETFEMPTVVEKLTESRNLFNVFIDKINGIDKIKEFNALKATLENVMKQNGINHTKLDILYWADIIDKNSKASNLPKELLIALVQRETGFRKCIASKTGNGPLQVTSITVKDLFSDLNGGRLVHYNNMDKSMMDEILYKEDIAGNKVPRFNSYQELHDECALDDNLGIKVGIMCFKMKFVEVVAKQENISIAEAISGLKDGTIVLSEAKQRFLVERTLTNFNSVFTNEYAKEVLDSLTTMVKDKPDLSNIIKG